MCIQQLYEGIYQYEINNKINLVENFTLHILHIACF